MMFSSTSAINNHHFINSDREDTYQHRLPVPPTTFYSSLSPFGPHLGSITMAGYPQQTTPYGAPTQQPGKIQRPHENSQDSVSMSKPRWAMASPDSKHHNKKVGWATNTTDNEGRTKKRRKSPIARPESPISDFSSSTKILSASRIPEVPASSHSRVVGGSSIKNALALGDHSTSASRANISRQLNLAPSTRETARPSIQRGSQGMPSASRNLENPLPFTNNLSRGNHGTINQAADRSKSASRAEANTKARRSSHSPSAKSSARRVAKKVEPSARTNHFPPVPEAPQHRGPPPTPRLARLPTPDLDDLSDREFCDCKNSFCRGVDHHRRADYSPTLSKMEAQRKTKLPYLKGEAMLMSTVNAAQAYMKGRRM
ncbi:hypothetical protein B0J14DRAFT_121732 [Halenospora varia]|nr:hypothetical protein B0J14DRAFT_121732 [Halenospora varia]